MVHAGQLREHHTRSVAVDRELFRETGSRFLSELAGFVSRQWRVLLLELVSDSQLAPGTSLKQRFATSPSTAHTRCTMASKKLLLQLPCCLALARHRWHPARSDAGVCDVSALVCPVASESAHGVHAHLDRATSALCDGSRPAVRSMVRGVVWVRCSRCWMLSACGSQLAASCKS